MAERFLYMPSFGVALLAGILWMTIPAKPIRRIAAVGLMSAAVLLCIGHNYIWHDNLSFYGNMVRQFPENMSGRLGYGLALLDAGRLSAAEEQFGSTADRANESRVPGGSRGYHRAEGSQTMRSVAAASRCRC